jgi:hypothetical protein
MFALMIEREILITGMHNKGCQLHLNWQAGRQTAQRCKLCGCDAYREAHVIVRLC